MKLPIPKFVPRFVRFTRSPVRLCLFILFASALACNAAIGVSGSATAWAYTKDDSVDHVYLTPTLSLSLTHLGFEGLSFQTALRYFSDFRNGKSHDEQIKILRGVFIYAPMDSKWEIRAGQQWLTEGVGRGNLAGLLAKYKFSKKVSVTAYGGARLANSLYLNEDNPENGYAGGLHARVGTKIGKFGASYYYLAQHSEVLYQAAGLEAMIPVRDNLSCRGRLDMNLEQSSIERAQLLAAWDARKNVQVTGEFRLQQPRIFEDSFFTMFLEDAKTTFARGAVRWTFYKTVYCKAGGTFLFNEDGSESKAHIAFGIPIVEVGYSKWMTLDNGELDGVYAKAMYRCTDHINAFAGYDFSQGSNSDLKNKRDSQAAYLGMDADVNQTLGFSLRGEQVRDVNRKLDYRGLFSITARFSNLR